MNGAFNVTSDIMQCLYFMNVYYYNRQALIAPIPINLIKQNSKSYNFFVNLILKKTHTYPYLNI